MAHRHNEAGFSIAETLIALVIFVSVVIPFAYLFAKSTHSAGQSQHLTVAYGAAQRQIQMLRAIPFGKLDNVPSNGFAGGTNFFDATKKTTVDGHEVYRTPIPTSLLPDPRTELPGATGTIDVRLHDPIANGGRTVNLASATVTITWTEAGRAPMSVNLRTLISEGGLNDF